MKFKDQRKGSKIKIVVLKREKKETLKGNRDESPTLLIKNYITKRDILRFFFRKKISVFLINGKR